MFDRLRGGRSSAPCAVERQGTAARQARGRSRPRPTATVVSLTRGIRRLCRAFRRIAMTEKESNDLSKLVVWVLLIASLIGCGLYAYRYSNMTHQQKIQAWDQADRQDDVYRRQR